MEISNELLAAYAEGKVSESERDVVREYLMENPDELESVLMMMDEDYELDLDDETELEDVASASSEESFSDICYSAAAFAPPRAQISKCNIESPRHVDKKSFNERLDELLDELDL